MDDQIFDALVEEFYLESRERLSSIEETLLEVEEASEDRQEELLVVAKRELHTLKGNSGMMGLRELQELAHELEDSVAAIESPGDVHEILAGVDRFRRLLDRSCGREEIEEADVDEVSEPGAGRAVQESVRVSFSALDHLVDLLSEMVIFRNRLAQSLHQALERLDKEERNAPAWREVEAAHQTLERTLRELQEGVMELRMVPLGSFFGQLKRIVFDESAQEGKEVDFRTSGGETPLDKALLEVVSEAMGHLVRNAVVHGIESPDERRERGKPPAGRLSVIAEAQAEEVVIEIEDDGRGIDRQELVETARERGFDVGDEADVQTLLSLPGLSTREEADRSAGRGMGMAAVMDSVRRRGGQVEIFSAPGKGTRFRLRLPLTAAILRAVILEVDDAVYALSLNAVQETLHLETERRHTMNRTGVVRWRGNLVPLLDLGRFFETREEDRQEGFVVIIEAEGRHRGLLVDGMQGIQDVVVKPLDDTVGSPPGLAGSTILGNGQVVLILDPIDLAGASPALEHAV
ncbi:MAG: chemotaxis protein CheW [Thermoanaerobaculia bacterium]|nr:chemotaxis protein CheW [Thermoanaerobaculia bacterium]